MTGSLLLPVRLSHAERQEINRLDRRCFPEDDPISENEWRRCRWFVWRGAEDGLGGYIGILRRPQGVGYIARVGTDPALRGTGVATALLETVVAWARQEGFRALVSDTELGSTGMQRVFTKTGFAPYRPSRKWALPTSLYWRRAL